MKKNRVEELRAQLHDYTESVGNLLADAFHYIALFVIGGITAWAGSMAAVDMLIKGAASIDDILLLFIYLELGAMVGIYFKTKQMPVRFLIYVAITALTRLMIADISHHDELNTGVLYVSGAILLLAISVLVVRFASTRFPDEKSATEQHRLADESHEGIEP